MEFLVLQFCTKSSIYNHVRDHLGWYNILSVYHPTSMDSANVILANLNFLLPYEIDLLMIFMAADFRSTSSLWTLHPFAKAFDIMPHQSLLAAINSLAPGGFDYSLKLVNFKLISAINISSVLCEIAIGECHNTSLIISQHWWFR